MNCPSCEHAKRLGLRVCSTCGNNLVSKPARTGEEIVRRSAWVAELEAALAAVEKLRAKAWEEGRRDIWSDISTASFAIIDALDRERSRSATHRICED